MALLTQGLPDVSTFGTALPLAEGPRLPSRLRSPTFVWGALTGFLLLLGASEAFSRLAARSGLVYRRFDLSGALTSLPELQDRIRWIGSHERPTVLLGDSILGASALSEHGVTDARRKTIPAFLAALEGPHGRFVQSLGADGLLLPDLEAIGREVARARPEEVLLLLNFRMFSREFQDGAKAVSRDFLAPDQSRDMTQRLSARACEHWVLFRTALLLRPLWYFPTQRDFFRRLEAKLVEESVDHDLQEAALRLKVAPYYLDAWEEPSLAFASLDRLLLGLLRSGTRVTVVLTPQNPEFVEAGSPEVVSNNRRLLKAFLQAREAPALQYRDWSDRYPAGDFLDHCHLGVAGNGTYARDLARLIERERP
jgi:hypothetical protein